MRSPPRGAPLLHIPLQRASMRPLARGPRLRALGDPRRAGTRLPAHGGDCGFVPRPPIIHPVMLRRGLCGLAALAAILSCGCVERWILIRSDPPGALVYLDGREAGTTPARIPFSFYGGHEILLRKPGNPPEPGYRSMAEMIRVRAPWYQYFPIDFFAENLWPGTIADEHVFAYALEPLPEPGPDDATAAEKARRLKERLSPGAP